MKGEIQYQLYGQCTDKYIILAEEATSRPLAVRKRRLFGQQNLNSH